MILDLYYTYNSNGPGKVIRNLKFGLDELGILYRENPSDIISNNFGLFLQWSGNIGKYHPENILIGPNVCVLPYETPFLINGNYNKCIVPSDWVKNKYSKWINPNKIYVWPVGIETNRFSDKSKDKKIYDCVVYYKNRNNEELNYVINLLGEKNQNFNIVTYGQYGEDTFLDLLSKSKYAFILDSTESQGIATQEIMSCNLPLFVWDKTIWNDYGPEHECPATSVPYWDNICGIKVTDKSELPHKFEVFLENLETYSPRTYVLENLSLKGQSEKIINMFKNV